MTAALNIAESHPAQLRLVPATAGVALPLDGTPFRRGLLPAQEGVGSDAAFGVLAARAAGSAEILPCAAAAVFDVVVDAHGDGCGCVGRWVHGSGEEWREGRIVDAGLGNILRRSAVSESEL
jgi:hypothetical protein